MAKIKPGDLEYCSSDGGCTIFLGFVPDEFVVDSNGNYIAQTYAGDVHKGIIPFGPYSSFHSESE